MANDLTGRWAELGAILERETPDSAGPVDALAKYLGIDLKTIYRYRNGQKPSTVYKTLIDARFAAKGIPSPFDGG